MNDARPVDLDVLASEFGRHHRRAYKAYTRRDLVPDGLRHAGRAKDAFGAQSGNGRWTVLASTSRRWSDVGGAVGSRHAFSPERCHQQRR